MLDNVLYHGIVGTRAGRGPPRAAAILALAAAIALAAAAVLPQDALPYTWTLHDAVSSLILAGHAFAQTLSNLILVPVGSLGEGGSRELDGAQSIAIFEHGGANYAAVASFLDDGVQIINLEDPASPSAAGHLSENAGRLNGASGIAVFEHDGANYAAVTAFVDDGVRIINLTNPASPSAVGNLRDSPSLRLNGAFGIAVFEHGGANYAAVTATSDPGVQIVNLTNPASPSAAGSLSGGGVLLASPRGIAIFEHEGANYAAVASSGSNAVQIINLTDPASPSGAGRLVDTTSLVLNGAFGIAVFEHGGANYAAVASTGRADDGVQIINLRNPSSPSAVSSLRNNGDLELNGARGIAVFEHGGANYAAVAANDDDGVQIINLTNPARPSAAGHLGNSASLELDGARGIAIFEHDDTNYAAVAAYDDDGVQILQIIQDTTAPTITIRGSDSVTVEAGRTYDDLGATCTDDIDGDITPTSDTTDVNINIPGTYTVTYTCTDAANNSATATRTVLVRDTTAPRITVTVPVRVTVLEGKDYDDLGATCRDGIDGVITPTSDTSDVNINIPGEYTVRYTCTDNAGNTATATRTVIVAADLTPKITIRGDDEVTLALGQPYNDLGADCFDGTDRLLVSIKNPVNINAHDTYIVEYSCTDTDGNKAIAYRTVIVGDVNAPVITVPGDNPATVLEGKTYTDAGATCRDGIDGVIIPTSNASDVDTETPGTYTITYTCTDNAGNKATAYRTVIVESNTPPTLTIWNHRPSVGESDHPSYASDAICTDAEDGNISNLVTTSVSVRNDRATITYSCMDSHGNTVKKIRQVPVTDTEPPTVVVTGQPVVEIIAGSPYDDAGATCTDDRPNATVMTTFSTVDPTTPGTYTVFYECTDAAGNKASGVRTVHVRPVPDPGMETNLYPVLTVPGPVTLTVGDDFEAPSATCTDHEDGNLNDEIDVDANSVNTEQVGRYTVFYTCTDSDGNLATGSLYVNVNP